ncbi:aromatic ring-hydroxylating dioxygenase subunit alpha [Vitiosangium sp. GDMCC 1.1324]|uniref:aromatic ring-hydroxylating oxygenase subunit alpha n=1 Tax=Vitiosangium sp. (strain GDMCC 1.1324) TaxID=2138576 RepID=UPI000D38513F|nr:aromatic ring-hydroxylating dioxygenase subunit alpha [Vitiosangium sp. GDMCC 1.1324]PTL84510.1 aromatic ring-hydroxylating dioxygenase subunit alpha [Vitiosangium sp. GDMCC 1.1324]
MLDGFANEGFADVWTPVAMSREVGKAPLGLTVASERIVLFRDNAGRLSALHDRCPHRGVKLSLGKVGKDGCLECPFHGWRFASGGACTHIPLNPMPEEKRKRFAATAFPVRERGGLIWLYTRPGAEAPDEPAVPSVMEQDGIHVWHYAETWNAHWTRAMENMLDSPHLPYVHRRSIGGPMWRRMKPDSKMEMEVHPTPTGFRSAWSLDGGPTSAALEWLRPNGMALHIPIPNRIMRLHMYCVPEDATHTRMVLVSTRDFLKLQPLAALLDRYNKRILREDQAVVESSDPIEAPPVSEERSVATDRATLAFRRWYLERKKRSEREATASTETTPLAS